MDIEEGLEAVQNAVQDFCEVRLIAIGEAIIGSILLGMVLYYAGHYFGYGDHLLLPVVCIGQVAVQFYLYHRHLRNGLSEKIIGVLATSVGRMTYQRSPILGKAYQDLPILPAGRIRGANNLLQGKLNGNEFSVVGLSVASDEDDGPTFKGMVVRVELPNVQTFKILPAGSDIGKFISQNFGKQISKPISKAHLDGALKDCFSETDQPFDTYCQTLAKGIPDTHKIHAVQRDGTICLLALSSSHDCFEIGGLFTGRAAVMKQIDAALVELQIPAQIALAAQQAEAILTSNPQH